MIDDTNHDSDDVWENEIRHRKFIEMCNKFRRKQ